MPRLFLITPARDEAQNLPRLYAALKTQTVPITEWLVLENNSTDGSQELLKTFQSEGAIQSLFITHEQTHGTAYALGHHYARLVAQGMELIRKRHDFQDNDYIGILDADTFPMSDYYQKLLSAVAMNPKLGLTSGVTTDENGKPSGHRRGWVRGSCRVWRGACLNQAGYPIGYSSDTLSAIKAECCGWQVAATEEALAVAREVGKRVKFGYYGKSAYYRGETFLHCLLRAAKYALKGKPRAAAQFLSGYCGDWLRCAPQVDDPVILVWSKKTIPRLLRKALAEKITILQKGKNL